jgi:hypothetical protein
MINTTTTIEARNVSTDVPTVLVEIKKTFLLTPRHIDVVKKMIANQAEYGSKHAWSEFRNHNDDVQFCGEMEEMGIIALDDLAWHLTYYLTDLGEELVKKLNLRSE